MKILLTTDCVGGVWTYAKDLTRELHRAGHEIVLAVTGRALADDQRAELDALGVSYQARPYALEWMPDADADLAATDAWLLGLAAEHQPDLVHLNSFAPAALDWPCPVLLVAHSDVVTWWLAVHGTEPPRQWDGYRRRVTSALQAADVVVAPTAAMLRRLRHAYDMPSIGLVIPNGRNAQVPLRSAEQQIAAVGRVWDEAKNIAAAVDAAAGLPWPLLVAGEGDAPGAQALGRCTPVQVADLLARSSIFVAPARYEPFGLAALEAAQAGCALVLGDIDSLREVWGDAAIFVDPDDRGALRAALQRLIDDPAELRGCATAAAQRAAGYGVATMTEAYEGLYRELAGAPATAARTAT